MYIHMYMYIYIYVYTPTHTYVQSIQSINFYRHVKHIYTYLGTSHICVHVHTYRCMYLTYLCERVYTYLYASHIRHVITYIYMYTYMIFCMTGSAAKRIELNRMVRNAAVAAGNSADMSLIPTLV